MEAQSQTVQGSALEIYVHVPTSEQLLPAICPACAAPGTTPRSVPAVGTARAALEAHYCDLCADDQNDQITRNLAWLAAGALLAMALSTALALAWGTRATAGQFFVVIIVAAFLPALVKKLGVWKTPPEHIWQETQDGGTKVHCVHPKYSAALIEHGIRFETILELDPSSQQPATPFQRHRHSIFLAAVAALWLALLHGLGGAEVRVLVGGTDDAILLVDARHFGQVRATNSEDPRAGHSVDVLGGRRRFQLISESGVVLADAVTTVWPGRTYIVAHLPEDRCLFSERRKYGKDARSSLVVPLAGPGPVWELSNPVDSWFVPLQGRSESSESLEQWETTGGERRAIRLLTCSGNRAP